MNKRLSWAVFLSGMLTVANPLFAQSGDLSATWAQFTTLGSGFLVVVAILVGIALTCCLMWGGVTLATNRPKGMAIIGGTIVGGLFAGLAFVIVAKLTGRSVGLIMVPIGF